MKSVRDEYGYQGIWADSFQNLFMSTRDWAAGDGKPLQRMWWEMIAEWSREGVTWTSESHAMPGLSCSIEADSSPFDNWWYYIGVSRWWRTHYPEKGEKGGDHLAFRLAAARGWAAPQVAYGRKVEQSIPNFKSLAVAYEKARPTMRRGYQLSDDRGALWLGHEGDGKGIWFCFGDHDLPQGVKAISLHDGKTAEAPIGGTIYEVSGKDLLSAFALKRGPVKDHRLGRPAHVDPPLSRPTFAKK